MHGQMKATDYIQRKNELQEYLKKNSPYEQIFSTVKLHELVDYAKQNNIHLTELTERDIEKFRVG